MSFAGDLIPLWAQENQPPIFVQNDLAGWLHWSPLAVDDLPSLPKLIGTVPEVRSVLVTFVPFVVRTAGMYDGIFLQVARVSAPTFTKLNTLKVKACLMNADGQRHGAISTAMPTSVLGTAYSSTLTFASAQALGTFANGSGTVTRPGYFLPFLEPNPVPVGLHYVQVLSEIWYSQDLNLIDVAFNGIGGYCRPTKRNPAAALESGFYLDALQFDSGGIADIDYKTSANCSQLVDATAADLPTSIALVATGSEEVLDCPYGEFRLLSPSLVSQRLY